jgi:hypothetical protein
MAEHDANRQDRFKPERGERAPTARASSSITRSKPPRPDETADIRMEVALVGVNGASAFDPPADGGGRSWVKDEKVSRAVAVDGPSFVPNVAPE